MIKHETITEARHAIMSKLKMLMKDAVSQGGTDREYLYTSAAFAATMIRPLMIEHGVVRRIKKSEYHGRWQNGVGVDYTFTYRYTLVGTKEPKEDVNYEDVEIPASGKVGKSGDKSTFAATTTGGKYADLIYYYLPMVDDVEKFDELMEALTEEMGDAPAKPKKVKTEKQEEAPFDTDTDDDDDDDDDAPDDVSSSQDLTYDEGALEVIAEVFKEGGEEAMLEFTKGDRRKDVKKLVKELQNSEPEEEEDDEPEEKPKTRSQKKKDDKAKKGSSSRLRTKKPEPEPEPEEEEEDLDPKDVLMDDEGYLDLDNIDYDNPKIAALLMESVDLDDSEFINECIDAFTDPEAMKSFYSVCLDTAGEQGADYQTSFNDEHFEHLQVRFEELSG